MNWKGRRRKRSWPVFTVFRGTFGNTWGRTLWIQCSLSPSRVSKHCPPDKGVLQRSVSWSKKWYKAVWRFIVVLYLRSRERIVRSVKCRDGARPSGFRSFTTVDLKVVPYFWVLCHHTKLQNVTVFLVSNPSQKFAWW